jgi:hypothetical protein
MRNLSPFTMIVAKNFTEREVTQMVVTTIESLEHELGTEIDEFMEAVS